jgi:hypothetical protein
VNVTVRLRPEGRKLLASATFDTPEGTVSVDFIYVKLSPGFDHPRVELPGRPTDGVFRNVIRIPDSWYAALVAAVERALEP